MKPRRVPSRHRRDARVYGHMTTPMHDDNEDTPPNILESQFRWNWSYVGVALSPKWLLKEKIGSENHPRGCIVLARYTVCPSSLSYSSVHDTGMTCIRGGVSVSRKVGREFRIQCPAGDAKCEGFTGTYRAVCRTGKISINPPRVALQQ